MPGYEVLGREKRNPGGPGNRGPLSLRIPTQRKGRYKVQEFEKKFAEFTGRKYALAVSSGTAALKVALAALGVGFGDEVITSGFTFVATWEAVLECGAVPVFSRIDDTLNLDAEELSKKITPRTKAIIPVHMLGAQARIEAIMSVADQHHIPVIELPARPAADLSKGRPWVPMGPSALSLSIR